MTLISDQLAAALTAPSPPPAAALAKCATIVTYLLPYSVGGALPADPVNGQIALIPGDSLYFHDSGAWKKLIPLGVGVLPGAGPQGAMHLVPGDGMYFYDGGWQRITHT